MTEEYTWTDNPTESGKATCDTDVLNDCLMHLKYDNDNNKSGGLPLLAYLWTDHQLNDMSYLLANTFSWQSGEAYSNAYNKLVEEYDNESSTTETSGTITYKFTPNGFKIADATQEQAILDLYNSTGSAKFYILDKENTRFKLPRWKHKTIKDAETIPVIGNGKTLGFTDGTVNFGFESFSNSFIGHAMITSNSYGTDVGSPLDTSYVGTNKTFGVTTDSTKSGLIAKINNIETDNMYLYFYVGEYTQSAIEQTAGLNAELLNAKADLTTPSIQAHYIKATYTNGTSGYRIWSDGYCEQWGQSTNTDTVTFLKTFADTNWIFCCGIEYPKQQYGYNAITSKTVNGFTFYNKLAGLHQDWKVSGYLAEGEY